MTQPRFPGLEVLSTAVILFDDTLKVSYVNPAAENLFEIPIRDFVGRCAEDIFERADVLMAAMHNALDQHCGFTEHDLALCVAGHPRHYLNCTVTPLDGRLARLVVELQPMDRRRRIAEEERQLNQTEANRELMRNLAHEIRNPLGGIRGAAQLLERELKRPDLGEYTQVIIKESDRLQSLMERLLTPQKLPQRASVNIHEVLERVKSLLLAEFPGGIRIHRDYDASLPSAIGDSEQLIQALLNVARNAAQALEGEGNITLRTRAARQVTLARKRRRLALEIRVIDDGPGIPGSLRERIFHPLVSGHEGGTGLGLTLAQSIIHQHQGSIECESAPGHTCFTILLPAVSNDGGDKR